MYGYFRGERNCNPLNIRISNTPWKGKIIPSKDPAFEQFTTSIDGIRAGAKILLNYNLLHGLQTIKEVISRWAPPNENDTEAYIACVCSDMDVDADDLLDFTNTVIIQALVKAIIHHEEGRVIYSDSDISQAVNESMEINA